MDAWEYFRDVALNWWPVLATLLVSILAITGTSRLFRRRDEKQAKTSHIGNQLILVAMAAIATIMIILELPIGDAQRGQLLSLFGLLLTGAVALSSTTLVGNAMAGLMLRAVRNFRAGDFIFVDGHFGRVSDQGLLHTEIQTEDRDLTTLPNLFLVTHPVKVVRSSGTIVSAAVSLGYDIDRTRIETYLLAAAEASALEEAFVQIVELGDYSVSYRVAGFLSNPKFLLTARSELRGQMLDALHKGGVEIVSPTFMNQRATSHKALIPRVPAARQGKTQPPEQMMFDKADQAERKVLIQDEIEALDRRKAEIDEALGDDLQVNQIDLEAEKYTIAANREALVAQAKSKDDDGDA